MRRAGLVIAALTCATALIAQSGAKNGEWRSYAGEEASTGYSPLDQINRDNVKDLKVAWAWKSDNFGTPEFKNESTPLMVKGVLYFTAGDRRAVVAVDAGNGETLWVSRANAMSGRRDGIPDGACRIGRMVRTNASSSSLRDSALSR